jgi:hypothetical protein
VGLLPCRGTQLRDREVAKRPGLEAYLRTDPARALLRVVERLSLFRIAWRIVAPIFPADVLSARFVRGLFLSPLVANDALLR